MSLRFEDARREINGEGKASLASAEIIMKGRDDYRSLNASLGQLMC